MSAVLSQHGIDHSKKMIADLGDVAVRAIMIMKNYSLLTAIKEVSKIYMEIQDMIKEAPGVLPELKSLDHAEAAQLAESAYKIVQDVIDAVIA